MTNIANELKDNYSLVDFKKADLDSVDAVIISGQDENVMGMMDKVTDAPVNPPLTLTIYQVEIPLIQNTLAPLSLFYYYMNYHQEYVNQDK